MQQPNGHHHLPPGTYFMSIVRMPSDTSDDDNSFRNIFPLKSRQIVSADKTERWSLHTSVSKHATNGVVKMTQIEHNQLWDHRICSYSFAGKSSCVNIFKNSAGEVLRKTVDYLKPLGKIMTEEEAKRMIKEFQEVANYNFTAVHAGNNPSEAGQGQPPSIPRPPPVPRPPVCLSNGLGAHWAGTGPRVGAPQPGGASSSAGATAGSSGVFFLADLEKDIAQVSSSDTYLTPSDTFLIPSDTI